MIALIATVAVISSGLVAWFASMFVERRRVRRKNWQILTYTTRLGNDRITFDPLMARELIALAEQHTTCMTDARNRLFGAKKFKGRMNQDGQEDAGETDRAIQSAEAIVASATDIFSAQWDAMRSYEPVTVSGQGAASHQLWRVS